MFISIFRDEVKQIMAEKDKDFDGYLSFEEVRIFCHWILPNFITLELVEFS